MGIARRWVFPILRLVVFAAIAAALVKLAFFGGFGGETADPAVVGFEMARLIKAVRPFLHTAARPAAVPSDRNRAF